MTHVLICPYQHNIHSIVSLWFSIWTAATNASMVTRPGSLDWRETPSMVGLDAGRVIYSNQDGVVETHATIDTEPK